jgi:hypothetical protein
MNDEQQLTPQEQQILDNQDLFMYRLAASSADLGWAIAGIVPLVVLAVEMGRLVSLIWAGGVVAVAVFMAGALFKRYRFKASAVAGQLRLAGGLLVAAGSFAAFGPRAWIAIATLALVGVPKVVREALSYRAIVKRMADIGKRRKVRAVNLVPGAVGLIAGGIAIAAASQDPANAGAMSAATWLIGYSALYGAVELWA